MDTSTEPRKEEHNKSVPTYSAPALRWSWRRLGREFLLLPWRIIQLPFRFIFGHIILNFPLLPSRVFEIEGRGRRRNTAQHLNVPQIEPRFVKTSDGARLITFDFEPQRATHQRASLQEQEELEAADPKAPGIRHILYFNGQHRRVEKSHHFYQAMANELHCPLTSFNYRGVGKSKDGNWFSRLFPKFDHVAINDGLAEVFYLLEKKNLELHQIGLLGHSLGGGIATTLAAMLDHLCRHPEEAPAHLKDKFKRGQEIYLFNERSFKSLFSTAWGKMIGSRLKERSVIGKIFFALRVVVMLPFAIIMKVGMILSGMESHIGLHFINRPKGTSQYAVIRPSKVARKKDDVVEDAIISPFASLDSSLFMRWQRHQQKNEIYKAAASPAEAKRLWKTERNVHKLTVTQEGCRDGHNVSGGNCRNRDADNQLNNTLTTLERDWIRASKRPRMV